MSLGGAKRCPLCRRWVHTTRRGRFYRHNGTYRPVPGSTFDVTAALIATLSPCPAVGKTASEADALAGTAI